MTQRTLLILGAAALALIGLAGWWLYARATEPAPAALPIERETTHRVEPLDAEGMVDYASILNAAVLPPHEQNAAIPLLRLLGTSAIQGDQDAVLARLGTPEDVPAEQGFELKPGALWELDEPEELTEPGERARYQAWIDRNAGALEALHAAARREALAWPLSRKDGMLQMAIAPNLWFELVGLLGARAELLRQAGALADGWRDIEVFARMAPRMGRSPLLVPRFFEMGLRDQPLAWTTRALAGGTLDAALCATIAASIQAIPPPHGLDRDVVDNERMTLLDTYVHAVRKSVRDEGEDPDWHPTNVALAAALREINRTFDEFSAHVGPDPAATAAATKQAEEAMRAEVKTLKEELGSSGGKAELAADMLLSGGAPVGRLVGRIMASVPISIMPMLAELRIDREVHRHLVLLALAVKRHELTSGAFPPTLEGFEVHALLEGIEFHVDEDGAYLTHGHRTIHVRPA